jgi:CRISPR-associated protein Cmr1
MKQLEYTIRFNTPAFLGNAEQQAQWRTPPFKALIRQWWRVVKAKEYGYKHVDVRQHEGDLFGNAWLSDGNGTPLHRKSRVALRLTQWRCGNVTSQDWPGGAMESVTTTRDGKGSVRADVYLGFGPVSPEKRKERRPITIRGAIGRDEENTLQLLPERLEKLKPSEQDMKSVRDAIQLMAWFGTLGSRSRNGWGALAISAKGETPVVSTFPDKTDALLTRIGREWTRCLELDWPHALGYAGDKPLLWVSRPYPDWRKVMGCLANIRVEVRAVAKTFSGPDSIGGIHLLGYPAGDKWTLRQFSKGQPRREHQEGRLATQLRFKVVQKAEGLVGMIFHMPHRFPDELMSRLNNDQQAWLRINEREVWSEIHSALNRSSRLSPLGGIK